MQGFSEARSGRARVGEANATGEAGTFIAQPKVVAS